MKLQQRKGHIKRSSYTADKFQFVEPEKSELTELFRAGDASFSKDKNMGKRYRKNEFEEEMIYAA